MRTQTFDFRALVEGVETTYPIRTVIQDGAPWFVAKDVCEALGLGNPTMALRPLGEDEKGLNQIETLGGPQQMRTVSESGRYKLVLRSDKPTAKPFQDWVTKVVLPAIRKDGAYIRGEEQVATGEMSEDEFVLRAVGILQRKVERLAAERDAARARVVTLEPMAAAVGKFEHKIGQFARTLPGVNAQCVKADLLRHGFLYQRDGRYRVYHQYRGTLFNERHDPLYGRVDIFVTPKGKEVVAGMCREGRLTLLKGAESVTAVA